MVEMEAESPASLLPSRGRSLNGCATCRSRHIKCDETKPGCQACHRSGLICGGYKARVTFDQFSIFNSPNCRRPLYSEADRRRMTSSLAASVCPGGTNSALASLESECEKQEDDPSEDFAAIRGPFTVFRLRSSSSAREGPVDEQSDGSSTTEEINFSPTADLIGLPVLDSLQEPANVSWQPALRQNELPEVQLEDIPVMFNPAETFGMINNYASPTGVAMSPSWMDPLLSPFTMNDDFILKDAVWLLQHFQNSVIRILSPPRYQKTPWHISFSPSVMNTLGALTMGSPISDTHMSIFYSILAISAYNLRRSGTHDRQFWISKGNLLQATAHEHLKRSLNGQNLDSPMKFGKYKDVLMSLLGLVSASVCFLAFS